MRKGHYTGRRTLRPYIFKTFAFIMCTCYCYDLICRTCFLNTRGTTFYILKWSSV